MHSLPSRSGPVTPVPSRPVVPKLIRLITETVQGSRRNAWVTIHCVPGETEDSLRQKACRRYRQLAGYACRVVAVDLHAASR
jgi:hypothetical protein